MSNTPTVYIQYMIHAAHTIHVQGDQTLTLGFTICFSSPAAQFALARLSEGGRPEIVATFSATGPQVNALMAALTAVREEIARHEGAH